MQSVAKNIGHFGKSEKNSMNFAIFLRNNCKFMQSIVENIRILEKSENFDLEIIMSLCNKFREKAWHFGSQLQKKSENFACL